LTKIYEHCKVCNKQIEEMFMESHHYIPESLGGTHQHTIRLCGTCHDIIHYFIPIEQISNYKTAEQLLEHESIKLYANWISNRNNTGHWHVKKVLKNIKVAC
jgi:hypothetical protein